MYRYYVLYLSWWWLSELKHVAEFLILITIYVVFIGWINYYIIAKHNGMTPIKIDFFCNSPANTAVITLVSDIKSPNIMANVRNTGQLCDCRCSQGLTPSKLIMFRSSGPQSQFQAVHPAYYSVDTGVLPQGYSGRSVKLTTHIHQVRKSRMRVAEPELPTMFSWHGQFSCFF